MENKKVLAYVGDREITTTEVELLMRSLDPKTASQFNSEEGKKRLVGELVNQELFYLDAIETGLDKDEAYLVEIERMKASVLKQFAVSRVLGNLKVSEEEIAGFYAENTQYFNSGASVQASHILVETEEEANDVLISLTEGLSFEEAAKKYSSCPSREKGGDLGHFTRGKMVPEFEEAAFNLAVGEVSSPVKTQFGFHIIKLVDIKKEETKSLDEVRGQISQQLLSGKQEAEYFNKIDAFKKKYPVKIEA